MKLLKKMRTIRLSVNDSLRRKECDLPPPVEICESLSSAPNLAQTVAVSPPPYRNKEQTRRVSQNERIISKRVTFVSQQLTTTMNKGSKSITSQFQNFNFNTITRKEQNSNVLTSAPFSFASIQAFKHAFEPSANASNSNTPAGPFQRIVFAFKIVSANNF